MAPHLPVPASCRRPWKPRGLLTPLFGAFGSFPAFRHAFARDLWGVVAPGPQDKYVCCSEGVNFRGAVPGPLAGVRRGAGEQAGTLSAPGPPALAVTRPPFLHVLPWAAGFFRERPPPSLISRSPAAAPVWPCGPGPARPPAPPVPWPCPSPSHLPGVSSMLLALPVWSLRAGSRARHLR